MPNAKPAYPGPINDADKKTLANAGVDVSPTPLRSEEDEEKIIDIDESTPASSDMKDTGITFVGTDTPNKEDLSALAEAKMRAADVASKDLEDEFRSELGDVTSPATPVTKESVHAQAETLSELLERIHKKLNAKKTTVKGELSDLKKMKDSISKDIGEIKELEASEGKIKEEIEKIETITHEVEEIEQQLGNET
jgi:hypothetical protein